LPRAPEEFAAPRRKELHWLIIIDREGYKWGEKCAEILIFCAGFSWGGKGERKNPLQKVIGCDFPAIACIQ
jgi:hypothetical protein